ncbi:DUF4199 domain-containing protein [Flavobacterium sp.]|uniref:DUF4199 domain-containing protein n=1 Tax=Flavobacterium sp. TaxID=239 RepID=UPI0033425462
MNENNKKITNKSNEMDNSKSEINNENSIELNKTKSNDIIGYLFGLGIFFSGFFPWINGYSYTSIGSNATASLNIGLAYSIPLSLGALYLIYNKKIEKLKIYYGILIALISLFLIFSYKSKYSASVGEISASAGTSAGNGVYIMLIMGLLYSMSNFIKFNRINEIVKKNGITFGIISGMISLLITTLIYTFNIELFISFWTGFISILIYIVISIILLLKTKKELNNVFPFKQAFTTYFISALIGIAISMIFNIILFNFIDPAAKETIKELSLKYAVEMMRKFNTPEDAMSKAIADLQANDQFSIGQLVKGSIFSIAFSAVYGLIIAAIFKSKTTYEQ